MSTRRGTLALAALGLAAVALLAVELALGALSAGETHLADPCTSKPAFDGGGLDGAVQRFALYGTQRRRVRAEHDARGIRPVVRAGGRRQLDAVGQGDDRARAEVRLRQGR